MKILSKVNNKIHREGFWKFLVAVALYPFGYRRRSAYKEMLNGINIKERFNLIYKHNLWGSEESGSGKGSEFVYTENLRNWLIVSIPKYSIETLVDAPCGDFNWMRHVVSVCKFNYIGLDIVDGVIEKNKFFDNSGSIKFDVANICEDYIPQCDLLMVRDCLFHLSYEDINKFLGNIARVNYKYLLTTTHDVPDDFNNCDIRTGDFRLISIWHPPFYFNPKSIIEFVQDNPVDDPVPRKMVLVAKKDVPVFLMTS